MSMRTGFFQYFNYMCLISIVPHCQFDKRQTDILRVAAKGDTFDMKTNINLLCSFK